MALRLTLVSLALLAACGQPEAPKEAVEAAPTCGLNFDTLADKTFVRQVRKTGSSEYEEDKLARVRFTKKGDVLNAKYTVRSLADVYDYTCTQAEGEITCWEDNPNAADWCRAIFANGQECTAAEIMRLTNVSQEAADKGVKEFQDELKKLPPKEIEDMKQVFNSPNNQLRGVMHIKIKADECRLTLADRYQTMSFGQLREMENFVGSSRFVESNQDYVFEHCKDNANLVALTGVDAAGKPGDSKVDWAVGEAVPFAYVGPTAAKAEAGCTYTMDTWADYEPVGKGVAVEPDAKGKLRWMFTRSFSKADNFVAHMYRYKACNGGAPEKMDVSCQVVRVK